MSASTIRIGTFTLNRRLGCLEDCSGKPKHLRPKAYRALEVLAERRGALVSKDDLAKVVWSGLAVTDESLSQCISDIRRALGKDDAKLLRTVPRRGFVLDAGPMNRENSATLARPIYYVAVAAILAVSVLAITVMTVNRPSPATDAVPWEASGTVLAQAYTSNSLGWLERAKNDVRRRELTDILATDPRNAEAWLDLGLTYWLEVKYSAWGGGRRELDQSLTAIERSLQLGGGAATYRLLAEIRLDAPFVDARSAVDALAAGRAAVDLDPNNPDGLAVLAEALTANGHAADAIPIIERALGAVSMPPDRYREIAGLTYLVAGEAAKAVEQFGRLHGAGTFAGARYDTGWFLAASLAHADRIAEAASVVEQSRMRRPEQTLDSIAVSLDHLRGQQALDLVLEGLRLAEMPT